MSPFPRDSTPSPMLHGKFPLPEDESTPAPTAVRVSRDLIESRRFDRRTLVVTGLAFLGGAIASGAGIAWRSRETRAAREDSNRGTLPWLDEMRALDVDDRIRKAGYFERLSRRALDNPDVGDEFELLAMLVLVSKLPEADLAGESCVRTLAKFERVRFLKSYGTALRDRPSLGKTAALTRKLLRERGGR